MRYTLELLPAPEGTALRITRRATYPGQEAAHRHGARDDAVFAQQMPELMRLLERHLAAFSTSNAARSARWTIS